jgi:hypothetical protein
MVEQATGSSGRPAAGLERARTYLRERQALWARALRRRPSSEVLAAALEHAAQREAAAERDGDYIREGLFRYEAPQEEARWALTRQIIDRVSPGPYEDPRYLEMLARQAASVEYVLANGSGDQDESGRAVLSRILIGTTGEPRSEGSSARVGDMAVIAMSGGMMDFMYQTSKALVLAWKVVPPPEGGGLSFSGRPEDTDEVLERDAYPIELLHDLLTTWLYEGRPRAPHSRMPPQHYQWPLQLLINGAERFVVAHEYGHALMDQLSGSGQDESAKNPDAELSDWERELRADSFAVMVVVESSRVLDLLPPNMALQGAIVAMKAHQIFDRALSTVQHGQVLPDDGSPTHPPFERRIAQLETLYLQHHPDSERGREDLHGMLVPSQTIEQLWTRVAPRLASYASGGHALHPVWSR